MFGKLGFTAFGGPSAHLALMKSECVERRGWLSAEEFMDRVGVANLVPGPSSTEVAMHLGFLRAGVPGLLAAGICFVLPAAILATLCGAAYVLWGTQPWVKGVLVGVKPVVVAIVAGAILQLAGPAVSSWPKRAVLAGALLMAILGVHEAVVLLSAGAILVLLSVRADNRKSSFQDLTAFGASVLAISVAVMALTSLLRLPTHPTNWALFAYFLQIGAVIYGSGYVLIAFLERGLVGATHWLSKSQLLDAIAVGQFTPGPVFTTASFIGFLLGGVVGAVVSTIGIFLPAFLFVRVSARSAVKFRSTPASGWFLDGVNSAAVALMLLAVFRIASDAVAGPISITFFMISAGVLMKFKRSAPWLILLGGSAGVLVNRGI